jgi:hypothetical protein
MSKSKMNVVTCKSDSEDIRIFVDGILHLRIPRDKNIKVQSWVEGHTKTFIIEIWCKNHQDHMSYDNKKLWSDILSVLDENI